MAWSAGGAWSSGDRECGVQICPHFSVGPLGRRWQCTHHQVCAGWQVDEPIADQLAQAPLDLVADDGVADRAGHDEAGTCRLCTHRLEVDCSAVHSPVHNGAVNPEPVRAEPARAGFVVSRAVGNAVVRNKVKRRLRELVRDRLTNLPAGTDLVVRALPAAAKRTYAEMGADLDAALAVARRPRSPRGPRHSAAQERTG